MSATEPIPDLEHHFLYSKCPACKQGFWNGRFQRLAYSLHYASEHLGIQVFRDLRAEGR